jgi:glycosyltransferase involved in cell wall biosynthesis
MQISVVVPVRDEEQTIKHLLDGLLGQTRPPDEIVMADGGSVDGTAAIIQGYIDRGAPIQLIRSGPALPGRGRNLAAESATCEWLAFIDAGVRPEPTWLEQLAKTAASDTEIDVVYGSYEPITDSMFKECAALAYVPPAIERDGYLMRGDSIVSALMKRSVWRAAGGFPEHLRSAEDLLFMRKVEEVARRIVYAPGAVVHWSLQPGFSRTFKRFRAYSRSNIQAGLWKQWQLAILQRYVLLALVAFSAFFLGWPLLVLAAVMWMFMLSVRAVLAIWRNRQCCPAPLRRNVGRFLMLVPIIVLLDAAAIWGTVNWLFLDKMRFGKSNHALGHGL